MKALRFLSALILIAGGGLIGRAVYLHAKAKLAGFLIRRAWQQTARSGEPRPPWPWAEAHPIARLRIPRLGYDEIVLDHATPRTLAFGPARLLSGALIGEPGNVVLAGHRDTWFLPLDKIAPGDVIEIEWFDARRHGLYSRACQVSKIRVVDPQDVSLLGPTPDDRLTLLTCYPFGRSPHSPQRYVVRAAPLGPSRVAKSATAHVVRTRSELDVEIGGKDTVRTGEQAKAYENRSCSDPDSMAILGWQCFPPRVAAMWTALVDTFWGRKYTRT